jgi:hypothetical protein
MYHDGQLFSEFWAFLGAIFAGRMAFFCLRPEVESRLFVADGTSEFDVRRPVAVHARLGEPRHAHATDFRSFFRSEINLGRRRGFLWRADTPARQCSHLRYSPFWLWPETSSRHPPKWGRSSNASHRQKGPTRSGGFVDAPWPGAAYCAPSVCRTPPH